MWNKGNVNDLRCDARITFVCEKRGIFLIHLKIYCCYKLLLSVYLFTWIISESTLHIHNSTLDRQTYETKTTYQLQSKDRLVVLDLGILLYIHVLYTSGLSPLSLLDSTSLLSVHGTLSVGTYIIFPDETLTFNVHFYLQQLILCDKYEF